MNQITRFDMDMDGSMEPSEHGQWVRYEDVKKLKQEQGEPMLKRLDPDDAWNFAKNVWNEMDRKAMPGIYMQLVTESIVKHYTKPQQRKPLTDEQKAKVARMFSDRISNKCNINANDHWKYHNESVLDDINFILQAAQEIKE